MAFKSCRICGIFWNQLQPQPTLAVPGSLPPSIPQELRGSLSSLGVSAGCALALAIGVVSGTVRLWSEAFRPHHVLSALLRVLRSHPLSPALCDLTVLGSSLAGPECSCGVL